MLQINLDNIRAAQDMLRQQMYEDRIDIILGQEPNDKNNQTYTYGQNKDSFIWVSCSSRITKKHSGNGFATVKTNGVTWASCYFSPNRTTEQFEEYINELNSFIRCIQTEVIIGGDFNAKSSLFGAKKTDRRGQILEEFVESNNLTPINHGHFPKLNFPKCQRQFTNRHNNVHTQNSHQNWQVDGRRH